MSAQRTSGPLQAIEDWSVKIIGAIIGLLLGLMVIIVFSNVISRYFLNAALAWSEEISRFMLIWLAFLGSYLAYVKSEHLGLDLLVFLPEKPAKFIRLIAEILVLAALAIFLYGGWTMTAFSLDSGWTSPALSIPYGFVYAIVPFSALLLVLQAFKKLSLRIRDFVNVSRGGE